MRWIAVSVAVCALAGCAGGENDQQPQAQAPPQAQTPSPAQTQPQAQAPASSQTASHALIHRVVQDGRLAPISSRFALTGWPPLIEARVVGDSVRYVLESDTPARFLKRSSMTAFLWNFRFGETGRPMVVRLLDGEGRFAWAAEFDGVKKMSVRARSDLARCGSIWNGEGRRLPSAPGAATAPRCPVELIPKATTATSASLLR